MKPEKKSPRPLKVRAAAVLAATALVGCLTDDNGGDRGNQPLASREVVLGSHDNQAMGGSIDLDNMQTFTYANAMQNAREIDLFYGFSETEQDDAVYAPQAAKEGVGGSLGFGAGWGGPADWPQANNTPLRRVTVADFDQIDRVRDLDSLWETGVPVDNGRLLVAENLDFMAETNQRRKVLLRVLDIRPGAAGTMELRARARFAGMAEE